MIRMCYVSSAIQGLTAEDYKDILAKARHNNQKLGVTGLLVVKGCFFAQVLEGEEHQVVSLFEKIKKDKRHFRVVMISKNEVDERIFDGWEMGFKDISISEEFAEVDLNDPKFVQQPELLDRVFRCVVNVEVGV